MKLVPALLGAALAASLGTPAHAAIGAPSNENLWTVSTGGNHTLAKRLDATCAFTPDRWTADYGPTHIDAYVTSTGAAYLAVRCEIYFYGVLYGELDASGAGPVLTANGAGTAVGSRSRVRICVSAAGQWNDGTYISLPTTCA